MTNHDRKKLQELTVFRAFAKQCPLPLLRGSAQNRPEPEPDILCDLECGDKLAFELVRCEDVTRDDGRLGTLIPTKLKDTMELEDALRQEYNRGLTAGRVDQPERFKFHNVRVYFENGTPSKNRRQTVVQRLIKLLNELGPGRHPINDGVIRSIQCEPYPIPSSIEGPNFYVPSGCGARPSIVERIEVKLTKNYKSNHEIHLLAWSTTATVSEFEGREQDKDLAKLLQSKGMGPFDRIWVFGDGCSEKSIVFDSATIDVDAKTEQV